MKRILTSLAILLLAVAAIVLAQGSGTWDGSGDWSYAVVDANTLDLTWNSQAIINWLKKLFKPDKHFTQPKRWARSILPDGSTHVVDSGSYQTTYFGIPFGRVKPQ